MVDVSELMLHQDVRVRDLTTDVKWTPVSDGDMMIVHVVALRVEEAPAVAEAAPAAVPAEPEVIKKGKTEKDKEEA